MTVKKVVGIMRKIITAALTAAIITSSLCGCNSGAGAEQKPAGQKTEEQKTEETGSAEQGEKELKECPANAADDVILSAGEGVAPTIDISDCDTFTQIVDTKLSDGMGYANVTIGETDVLLVSSGTFDDLNGSKAAIDATVFMYDNEKPVEVGKLACGGTAYPLSMKDNALYVGSNHWMAKVTIDQGKLSVIDKTVLEFDKDGNESVYRMTGADLFADLENTKVINFDPVGGKVSSLPKYEYSGPELFYTVIYKYLVDELGSRYSQGDVTIPCPIIVAEDESNKEDIKVWGVFWVFNYKLNGDVLECVSGGSHPGCLHVKDVLDDPAGYVVTEFEQVGDGSDYEPTAKKIFGKYYKELEKASSDEKKREELRAQIIANYAYDNNLKIKSYQDYGWDPVPLPTEITDGFYGFDD